jgi:hypothetical protein
VMNKIKAEGGVGGCGLYDVENTQVAGFGIR